MRSGIRLTLDNQSFLLVENEGKYVIYDACDHVIGSASRENDAVKICEQIAWRRKMDGKVEAQTTDTENRCGSCRHFSLWFGLGRDSTPMIIKGSCVKRETVPIAPCEDYCSIAELKEDRNES